MKQEYIIQFTVRHISKHVYWGVWQYSLTQHIITNAKHMGKWRNIKLTDAPRTNNNPNSQKW